MSAGLNVLITLKDMFSASMGKIGNSTNQQTKRIEKLKKEMSQLKSSMITSTGGFMKAGLGLMGVSTALDSLSNIASQAMGNYALQAKAEGQVLGSLKRSMEGMDSTTIDNMADSYKNLASELQGVGVIGDEVTLTGMAKMTSMGMKPEAVKAMTPYVQDLAVKLHGVDVNAENFAETSQTVANSINKGSLKAFQSMGLQVTEDEQKMFKAMNTTERTAYLQNKLAKEIGGTNKAMANTPAGKQAQAMNSYGDALEAVGKPLYQLKGVIQGALIAPMTWLAEKIPIAVEWFTTLASTIGGYFAPVLESLGLEESATTWEFWGDIIGNVLNEVGFIIGLVAKVIGATIAGVMYVIVQLGKVIYAVCEGMVSAWQGMTDMIIPIIDYWINHVANVLEGIWNIFDGTIKLIVGLLVGDWSTAWNGAGEVFTGVMQIFETAWSNTFGLIVNGIDYLADKLSSFKNKLMGGMDSYNTAVENAKAGDYSHGTLGFATGTSYFKGGFTHINENNRGELVNLPNGSQVIPHDLSMKMMGNKTVNINVNVQGNVIGNEDFYNECGNAIYKHLKNALGNV